MPHTRRRESRAYQDMRPVIDGVIRTHRRRFGGRPDDLAADAGLYFVLLFRKYDYSVPLDCWVRYKLSRMLHDAARTELRRSELLPRVEVDDLDELPSPDTGGTELSHDATITVGVALAHADKGGAHGHTGTRGLRRVVWNYLRGIGWTSTRIGRAFQEVKESL